LGDLGLLISLLYIDFAKYVVTSVVLNALYINCNSHRVIFKNTVVTAPFNKALWSVWNTGDPRTDNILFADYNSTGSGVSGASRPSFATLLSSSQATAYSISSAVGSDYTTWVDMSYFV